MVVISAMVIWTTEILKIKIILLPIILIISIVLMANVIPIENTTICYNHDTFYHQFVFVIIPIVAREVALNAGARRWSQGGIEVWRILRGGGGIQDSIVDVINMHELPYEWLSFWSICLRTGTNWPQGFISFLLFLLYE